MKIYDVCILGGGASGLAVAASLNDKIKACIVDKNQILGRKILATGGGRCNITNDSCSESQMSLDFFGSLGIETYCDDEGRYYPYSNQASDVVKALEIAIDKRPVDVYTGFNVSRVIRSEGRGEQTASGEQDVFLVADDSKPERQIAAHKLVLAMGGKAGPNFGTTGDGYNIARKLGHTTNKIYPILTGVECDMPGNFKGIRAKGKATLLKDGAAIASETGEIQFKADGVSGICIMNLSSHITTEPGENIKSAMKRYQLVLDLAPDFTNEQIEMRASSFGILSEKLSSLVGISDVKKFTLNITGVKGWKDAQCTGGGIPLHEVNRDTMESLVVPGLYIVGEVLDCHGPCGGYNLQYAWETGIKAARHINKLER